MSNRKQQRKTRSGAQPKAAPAGTGQIELSRRDQILIRIGELRSQMASIKAEHDALVLEIAGEGAESRSVPAKTEASGANAEADARSAAEG